MLIRSAWRLLPSISLLAAQSLCGSIDRRDYFDGPWNSDGPFEGDVIQNAVGDCTVLSTMVSIIRHDRNTLLNAVDSLKDNCWPISLYLPDGTYHTFQIETKSPAEHKQMGYSETQWVAYFERAMSEWFDLQNVDKNKRGNAGDILRAFYGPEGLNAQVRYSDCSNLVQNGQLAKTYPMTLSVRSVDDKQIPGSHSYAFHDANNTHVILRNPWGFVMKAGEKQKDMPPGVTKMDDLGTFAITVDEAKRVGNQLFWAVIPQGGVPPKVRSAVASANAQADAAATYDTALDPFTTFDSGVPAAVETIAALVSLLKAEGVKARANSQADAMVTGQGASLGLSQTVSKRAATTATLPVQPR